MAFRLPLPGQAANPQSWKISRHRPCRRQATAIRSAATAGAGQGPRLKSRKRERSPPMIILRPSPKTGSSSEKERGSPKPPSKNTSGSSDSSAATSERLPVKDIGTAEVLRTVRRLETRGRHHSAKRYRATLSRIFKYGIACGRADRDPAADISKALISAPTTPRPAITTLTGVVDALAGDRRLRGIERSQDGAPAADACFLPSLRAAAYGVVRDRLRKEDSGGFLRRR